MISKLEQLKDDSIISPSAVQDISRFVYPGQEQPSRPSTAVSSSVAATPTVSIMAVKPGSQEAAGTDISGHYFITFTPLYVYLYTDKQVGNGISRRHIQGSKIAKGLQNVKLLVNLEPSMKKKLKKSLTMPKKLKGKTHRDFSKYILLQSSKKMKGDPLVEKNEKKLHSAEKKI